MKIVTSRWSVGTALRGLVVAGAAASGALGCAGAKFDSLMPVQAQITPIGVFYSQDGHRLDMGDVKRKLSDKPSTSGAVSSSRALQVLGLLSGAAGGGLIGYPVGQDLAKKDRPDWTFAAVGAGAAGVGLLLGILSDVLLKSAVDTHNRELNGDMAAPGHPTPAPVF